MYFKALEMRGFKSFPERTVLTFDKPLTAIVGPNGSGKSNLADAIAWVMGEQSTKTLRGGKMEDVIFGGTEKRGPVGFAEVSLTLDNSDRRLAEDMDEVKVTRRYYRSGESEYYINKNQVRLKDINELFMDTGLGRDGYSIIGQGKIDSILSAKSTDRREIFEEAAGISRFRHRKEESERKLERAEEDLTRVNDKIGELELQVEPLRRQSEIAKRYLVLRDELRGLEISLWLTDLEAIAQRTKELESQSLAAAGDLERARTELEKLYSAGETFAQRMREKDLEADEIRTKVTETEQRVSDEEAKLAVIGANIGHAGENIQRIRDEIDRREGQSTGILGQIEERRERLSEIDKEKGEITRREEELRARSESLYRGEGAVDERAARIVKSLDEATEELSGARVELSSLVASVSELDERAGSVAGETAAQEERVARTEREAVENGRAIDEAKERLSSAQNVCRGYELRLEGLKKRSDDAQERGTKLQMEVNAMTSRRQLLSDMEREYEGYSKAVKTVMREADRGILRGIHGPAGELVTTESKYAVAIETALGAAVQNIIVGTDTDGKNVINHLKRLDGGRVTLLPMNVIRGSRLSERGLENEDGFEGVAFDLVRFDEQYREIYLNLLGRTAVADDMDCAVRIGRKFGHRFRIVTLDGQVINAGGSMTGGSAAKNTGILSRANELKELKEKEKALTEKLAKAIAERDEAKRALTAAEYETQVALNERREAEDSLLKLTSSAEHYEVLLNALKERLEELKADAGTMGERRRTAAERAESVKAKIAELEGRTDELKAELDAQTAGREKLGAQRQEILNAQSELRERRASLEAEAAAAEKAVGELTALREELSGDNEAQEAAIRALEEQEAGLRAKETELKAGIAGLKNKAEELRGKITAIMEARMEIEAERSRSDKRLQDKNSALLDMERAAARVENRIEAAKMEEKQIIDKLWDGYGLSRSSAMEQRLELESIPQAKRRTGELKREISSLGTPNIGAIEEFERVNTRYTYLTEQRDDIEKAKSELLGIIGEITGSMETIFKDELERINTGFQQTFLELFGGGRASVSLEDPEDVLGSGIEIRVQPPGKSLKTITLLSGGEKAFVAIALYFAILKIRPTPFVVMDEIEAALDDANVIKTAEYMRRLADKTQFLIITHRRGTMEEADVLYGVTMQEQGVSKVLTVDLEEAEKTIKKA